MRAGRGARRRREEVLEVFLLSFKRPERADSGSFHAGRRVENKIMTGGADPQAGKR